MSTVASNPALDQLRRLALLFRVLAASNDGWSERAELGSPEGITFSQRATAYGHAASECERSLRALGGVLFDA